MASADVHAVMCGDRNILWGMAVAGRSALEHGSVPIGFNILGTGLTAADRKALEQSWRHPMCAYVRFIEIDYDDIKAFRSTAYLKSKAAYSRYFIGRIPDVDRIVYLDTDLIVLRDLAEVAQLDLRGNAIAAVLDISTRREPEDRERRERLGLRNEGDYFNSGFLVLDMAAWRARDAEAKLLDISVSMYDRLHSQDQDALNIVFEGDTLLLGVEWNMSQYEAEADVEDVVLHLIGTVKPWHPDYHYKFADRFFAYLDRTAYAGRRPGAPDGLAARLIQLGRKVPTLDMLRGKLRRALS